MWSEWDLSNLAEWGEEPSCIRECLKSILKIKKNNDSKCAEILTKNSTHL